MSLAYPDRIFNDIRPQVMNSSGRYTVRDSSVSSSSEPLKEKFEELASKWRAETETSSFIVDIVLNRHYQSIIGLGWVVVPYILTDLRNGPDHWYWALAAITGADPAADAPEGDIGAICDAWLAWGQATGIKS